MDVCNLIKWLMWLPVLPCEYFKKKENILKEKSNTDLIGMQSGLRMFPESERA